MERNWGRLERRGCVPSVSLELLSIATVRRLRKTDMKLLIALALATAALAMAPYYVPSTDDPTLATFDGSAREAVRRVPGALGGMEASRERSGFRCFAETPFLRGAAILPPGSQ